MPPSDMIVVTHVNNQLSLGHDCIILDKSTLADQFPLRASLVGTCASADRPCGKWAQLRRFLLWVKIRTSLWAYSCDLNVGVYSTSC